MGWLEDESMFQRMNEKRMVDEWRFENGSE